jgi:hypothetical protein
MCLNFGPEMGSFDYIRSYFSSVPPDKYWCINLNDSTVSSFHILSIPHSDSFYHSTLFNQCT